MTFPVTKTLYINTSFIKIHHSFLFADSFLLALSLFSKDIIDTINVHNDAGTACPGGLELHHVRDVVETMWTSVPGGSAFRGSILR